MKGHGYRIGDKTLCIGNWPDRKRPVLYVETPGMSWPLAFFRSEEAAQEALALLDLIAAGQLQSAARPERTKEE